MSYFPEKRAPEIKPLINPIGRQINFSRKAQFYCENKVEELFDNKPKNLYFEKFDYIDEKLCDRRTDVVKFFAIHIINLRIK